MADQIKEAADIEKNIREMGENELAKSPISPIHIINIIGQIEGHMHLPHQNKTTKYEHIIPQLVAIEQCEEVHGFLVIMNTAGGDVEAGLALAEMVAGMTKPSVSLILGGGHSIGVPLAVSADYSFITPSASMTVHPIRMNGMIVGIPQTFEYFNKMQDRVIDFVCRHSNMPGDKYRELMLTTGNMANETGTVLVGKQAVDVGLINELGSLADALAKLKALIQEKQQ
jgi:ATP-dependent protease ClpP protease subunit